MSDNTHTEQPPERKVPSKLSSTVLKIGAAASLAFAAAEVYLGVMAFKGKGWLAGRGNEKAIGIGSIVVGGVFAAGGIAAFKHANFAGIVREANRRDELLLQRASIDKELSQQHSR